jgi:hypothetical protein
LPWAKAAPEPSSNPAINAPVNRFFMKSSLIVIMLRALPRGNGAQASGSAPLTTAFTPEYSPLSIDWLNNPSAYSLPRAAAKQNFVDTILPHCTSRIDSLDRIPKPQPYRLSSRHHNLSSNPDLDHVFAPSRENQLRQGIVNRSVMHRPHRNCHKIGLLALFN